MAQLYFFAKRQYIRHQMEERLEQAHLTKLSIPTPQLFWAKPGKELIWQGKYFDVKKVIYQSSSVTVLTGIYDDEETIVQNRLKQILHPQKSSDEKRTSALFFSISILPSPAFQKLRHNLYVVVTAQQFYYIAKLPATYISVPTPPPLV